MSGTDAEKQLEIMVTQTVELAISQKDAYFEEIKAVSYTHLTLPTKA